MEILVVACMVLVIAGTGLMVASGITKRNKLFLVSLLALALGMACNAAYHVHAEDYGWAAFDLALVAANVGNFFWSRNIERKKATV